MISVAHLVSTVPSWATIGKRTKASLRFEVVPPLDDGTPTGRIYELVVHENPDGEIEVEETSSYRVLPKFCVERHINDDGTFCLFLNSTKPITSENNAYMWWEGLRAFLGNQVYAEKWRRWPPNALSHGAAADTQIKMEQAADALGWQVEVYEGIYANLGWLGSDLPKLIDANGKGKPNKVVNARSACPRRCVVRHRPAVRRNCLSARCGSRCPRKHRHFVRADCPNRAAVEELIILEHKRRSQEQDYIAALKRKGVTCCGTMDNCALR